MTHLPSRSRLCWLCKFLASDWQIQEFVDMYMWGVLSVSYIEVYNTAGQSGIYHFSLDKGSHGPAVGHEPSLITESREILHCIRYEITEAQTVDVSFVLVVLKSAIWDTIDSSSSAENDKCPCT